MFLFRYLTFFPYLWVLTELACDFSEYLKYPYLGLKVVFIFPKRWTYFLWTPPISFLTLKKWEHWRVSSSWMCVTSPSIIIGLYWSLRMCRDSLFCLLLVCQSVSYMMGRKGSTGIFQILRTGYWGICLTTVPAWWTQRRCHMNNLWRKVPTMWLF